MDILLIVPFWLIYVIGMPFSSCTMYLGRHCTRLVLDLPALQGRFPQAVTSLLELLVLQNGNILETTDHFIYIYSCNRPCLGRILGPILIHTKITA
jgi:hypothetical protein